MKKIICFVAVMAVCLSATSCKISIDKDHANIDRMVKTLETNDFTRISLNGHGDLILTQDSVVSVVIEAPEDKIEYIKWEILNGELRFWYGNPDHENKRKVVLFDRHSNYCIRVSAPDIENIRLSGSGDIKVSDFAVNHAFGLSLAGSGDIETGIITAPEITANLAGSGDIELRARNAETMELSVAGSGDIEARLIDCGEVLAKVAGSGDIELKGNARKLEQKVAGSGEINTKALIIKE